MNDKCLYHNNSNQVLQFIILVGYSNTIYYIQSSPQEWDWKKLLKYDDFCLKCSLLWLYGFTVGGSHESKKTASINSYLWSMVIYG